MTAEPADPADAAERAVATVSEGATRRNPYLAMLLAWLVPGAGHFYLGRRGRAVVFLVLVAISICIGVLLRGKLFVIVAEQPLSRLGTLASMGMGIPYFVLQFALGSRGDIYGASYEYGSAFLLTAGLMNLLVILDAWDIAGGHKD
jgi:TM2 domain-containing membrane protein YozV